MFLGGHGGQFLWLLLPLAKYIDIDISLAWIIKLAFSATLSNLVLLDSLIRLSESFLMMYRSGGRSRGPGGSISPEVPRINDLAG